MQAAATKSATLIFRGAFAPAAGPQRARQIMGRNFFGAEDAVKHLKIEPSPSHLAALGEVPISEAVLEESKDSHILVAVFPISILDLRGKADRGLFHNQTWYRSGNDAKSPEAFAADPGEASWHLVRKTAVPNSTAKTWSEQLSLIGDEKEVPGARVMVYTIMAHFAATGERLFESSYVRTSTIESAGLRVGLGDFDSNGLFLGAWWDSHRNANLGLSCAWNPRPEGK